VRPAPKDGPIELRAPEPGQRGRLFTLYEASLRPYIEAAFGWNHDFQVERFETAYPDEGISVVWCGGQPCGYIAVRPAERSVHLALLLLDPLHRGSGIGANVMDQVEVRAAALGQPVTLSCFKGNVRALSFYERRGYRRYGEDEHFFELSRAR
jgi:ribosomal protein S18 acetylase RimI-like enzyme